MYISELTYPFEQDRFIQRESAVTIGQLCVDVQAITLGGKPGKQNQDAFGFCHNGEYFCAGVLDGAMSRDASHIGRDLLERSEASSAPEVLKDINRGLSAVDLQGGASTCTLVGVHSEGAIDLAHVTDSWAMALFRDGSTRLLTTDQHEPLDTALDVMANVANERGVDLHVARQDQRVKDALAALFTNVRNTPDGSGEGILNGSPHMDRYIETLKEPLHVSDVATILMGSDGARFPNCTETDTAYRSQLFAMVACFGLAEVVSMIHDAEILNPPTRENPRWSQHGDKTLVALNFRSDVTDSRN